MLGLHVALLAALLVDVAAHPLEFLFQFGNLILPREQRGGRIAVAAASAEHAVPREQLAGACHKIQVAMLLAAAHRGVEIRHDDQAAKQPVEQRLNRVVASQLAKRCHAAKLAQLGRVDRRRRAAGNQVERNNVRAPFFAFAQRRQNRLGIGGLPGDDQLQMPAKRGLHGGDVFSRHADLIGQQTKRGLGLPDGCLRPGADALVGSLQLLEDIQSRPFFGLDSQ